MYLYLAGCLDIPVHVMVLDIINRVPGYTLPGMVPGCNCIWEGVWIYLGGCRYITNRMPGCTFTSEDAWI